MMTVTVDQEVDTASHRVRSLFGDAEASFEPTGFDVERDGEQTEPIEWAAQSTLPLELDGCGTPDSHPRFRTDVRLTRDYDKRRVSWPLPDGTHTAGRGSVRRTSGRESARCPAVPRVDASDELTSRWSQSYWRPLENCYRRTGEDILSEWEVTKE